jgi:hypothetical protein
LYKLLLLFDLVLASDVDVGPLPAPFDGFEAVRAGAGALPEVTVGAVLGLQPGVDVMIAIFCDFQQFSAKKLAFFSKTNVMIKIWHM